MRQVVVAVVILWSGLVAATVAGAQPRGADDQPATQLGFFIGRWTAEGQAKGGPTGAFSRVTGEETCAWFSGGPSLVCRETSKDSLGETDSIYILAYDAGKKVYTMYGTDNYGVVYAATGTLERDVWRWVGETRKDGVSTPTRYTFRPSGNAARTMEMETSTRGVWSRSATLTYKRAAR